MEIIKGYLLQNWALVLILLAFGISLMSTVFLEKKLIRRNFILIGAVFLLSISVFTEFYIVGNAELRILRIILMAIRYSATPFILSLVLITFVKKLHWIIFVPAIALAIIDIVSIFTGIVFEVDENNVFTRGPLGYLPFIIAGLYCVLLVVIMIKRCNKRPAEIISIAFLTLAFASGLILPFVFGSDFSNIFCTTIGIALFAYYEFSTLQLTKTDALTGLLNRQAYYADVDKEKEIITAILSIDMNGLKPINDNEGHAAGDEALTTLALCFKRALRRRQTGYRIGGDEFVIVCRKNTKQDVIELVDRIRHNVGETKYTCSIGYGYSDDNSKSVDDLLKESDEMLYKEKEQHYLKAGKNRRRS